MFKEYGLGKTKESIDGTVDRILADFGNLEHHGEEILMFATDLLPELAKGRHKWTMRYKPNGFRHPCSTGDKKNVLPVCVQLVENGLWVPFGTVAIPRMVVGHVKDWPYQHKAIRGSGWRDGKWEMIHGLSDIYRPIYGSRWGKEPRIGDDDIIFAYQLSGFKMHPEFVRTYKRRFG